ncbi:MAG TPA: helix-turn-helix domain-containing protein [Caldilineaceae bacterium]|nr:helix-turn-helix domain-containing protein [Caldilineaceae bacterium]
MAQFYSIQEAADYLQVDYKVVYRLVRDGSIPSARVGWQYRMTLDDLSAYLNAQRVKQSKSAGAPPAQPAPSRQSRANGKNSNGRAPLPSGVSRVQARQMEQNALNRFRKIVQDVATIQHPTTKEMLYVDRWDDLYTAFDNREALMQAFNTAFLDRETLATTPHNSRARFTVPGVSPLVLEMRFVGHLETFCSSGSDDTPVSLQDLLVMIEELNEEQEGTGAVYVMGLASPTGWAADAVAAIRNTGTGQAYFDSYVRIFLLDLLTGELIYDELDPETGKFAGLFRLPTPAEDQSVLADQLRAESARGSGLILNEFAAERKASLELVLNAARSVEAEGHHRLLDDPREGWMLVNV